jgi:mRNA degradation ribonuclease J1/J2
MTSRSLNINPHNISPNRTRSALNTSDHCVENRSGTCSEVENTSISVNHATSNSTNIILATSFHNRTRQTLTNSSHCTENRAGSRLEDEVTATFKTTPIKETRKSLRQFILRNKSNYIEHVKEGRNQIYESIKGSQQKQKRKSSI